MSLSIDLKGKKAIVTGATGQLGRVIAATLAQAGADLALHYFHNKNQAETLQKEILALGSKACLVQGDITKEEEVRGMQRQIVEQLGEIDIVVTNAVSQIMPWSTILEESIEDYEDQFRSCTLQNVIAAKVFVPHMILQKWGRLIGINTECSLQLGPTMSAYAGAKRGMDGVLKVLAKEIGEHQITVNQIAPGWTISERDRVKGTEENTEYQKTVPLKRRGRDDEIASAVAFLASDLASFITGATLPVCGGNVMI